MMSVEDADDGDAISGRALRLPRYDFKWGDLSPKGDQYFSVD